MRVRIHRGAHEVGGSCVEIEHDDRRIVLDIGLPLDSDFDADRPIFAIAGLASPDAGLLGVLVSHAHPDHYGLVAGADPSVAIYIGEGAHRVLAEAAFFTPGGGRFEAAGFLRDREPFELGPFRVTPYLMDHSAFDAYALLVEAGGRRLLYSGDIRAHGRKAALFERFIAAPPDGVDALLLEVRMFATATRLERPACPSGRSRSAASRSSARPRGWCWRAIRRRTSIAS